MLPFVNTPVTKDQLIANLQAHYDADEIEAGHYWQKNEHGKFTGCAVGCSIQGLGGNPNNHFEFERLFNIHEFLAHLQDKIFERLPQPYQKEFPLRFANAIQVGVDVLPIKNKFLLWCLNDEKYGAINFSGERSNKKITQKVIDLLKRSIAGDEPSLKQWKAAYTAADATAYAAATAAYAYAYADAAVNAVNSAYAVDAACAACGDGDLFWIAAAHKLIDLMKNEGK